MPLWLTAPCSDSEIHIFNINILFIVLSGNSKLTSVPTPTRDMRYARRTISNNDFALTDCPSYSALSVQTTGILIKCELEKYQTFSFFPVWVENLRAYFVAPWISTSILLAWMVYVLALHCPALLGWSEWDETQDWCFPSARLIGGPGFYALKIDCERQSIKTKYHQSHILLANHCEIDTQK